jgi:hypothetical protein
MSCPIVETLSNLTFVNACVVTNVGSNQAVQSALQTCCGFSNVHTVNNGCYAYCNITTIDDELLWSACLSDNLGSLANIYGGCFDDFGLDGTGTASGKIATTWTFPNVVTTLSSGATLTLGFGDNTLTGSTATGSTATATAKGTATKTSSSTSTPTSSEKASEAPSAARFSFWAGLLAGLGFWRFLV